MQNRIDTIFNFDLIIPLAYTGDVTMQDIEDDLHSQGVFIFSVFTDPRNPFFIEVQKQMFKEGPNFKIKVIILGIRYNKEFIA